MFIQQSLQQPLGITAFGSSIIRVEPDIASLHFSVSRLEQTPKDAFRLAREGAKNVQSYLAQTGLDDYGSSRITLSQTFRYVDGEQRFIGYTSKIAFHLLLRELDRIEEILVGITDAGVNNIDSVDYQTSQLKDLRTEARKRAVFAAREKAEIYCQAANVTLGPVIHIEDVNPEQLRGREGHVVREIPLDEDGPIQALNPGSIIVGGAVMIACEIEKESRN
jgi:uncharacterized protein YggE